MRRPSGPSEKFFLQALWEYALSQGQISDSNADPQASPSTPWVHDLMGDASTRLAAFDFWKQLTQPGSVARTYWPQQLNELIADTIREGGTRALIGNAGMGKSTLIRTFQAFLESAKIPFLQISERNVEQLHAQVDAFLGVPPQAPERRVHRVIMLDHCPKIAPTEDLDQRLKKSRTLLVYTSEIAWDLPSEKVLRLGPDQSLTLIDRSNAEIWTEGTPPEWKLPKKFVAAACALPLALSLATGTFAYSPDGDALKLAAQESALQAENDPILSLLSAAVANLPADAKANFQALLGLHGLVDHAFASHYLANAPDGNHLELLIHARLVETYGGMVEIVPSLRTAAQQIQIEAKLDGLALAEAVRDRLERVAMLDQQGKWKEAEAEYRCAKSEYIPALQHLMEAGEGELYLRIAIPYVKKAFESEDLTDLKDICGTAASIARDKADSVALTKLLGLDGAIQLRAGDVQIARNTWLERLEIAQSTHQPEVTVDAFTDLAALEYEAGNPSAAFSHLDHAETLAQSLGLHELHASALMIRAHLELKRDHRAEARALIEQADELRKHFKNRDTSLFVHQTRANLLIELGELELAHRDLLELLRNANEGHRAVIISWTLRKLGHLFELQDQGERALDCFTAAVLVHEELLSRHRRIATDRLIQFLGNDDLQAVGATLAKAPPWPSTVDQFLGETP